MIIDGDPYAYVDVAPAPHPAAADLRWWILESDSIVSLIQLVGAHVLVVATMDALAVRVSSEHKLVKTSSIHFDLDADWNYPPNVERGQLGLILQTQL